MNPEIERLAKILKKLRDANAEENNMSVAVHFFAIKYATHLQGFSGEELERLVRMAETPDTWTTEIQKMLKLSKYVSVKQDM